MIPVSELFGPTIQGEGPSVGTPAGFVRTVGCNLTCAWCDTPYTWDWKGLNGRAYRASDETTPMESAEIADRLAGMGVPLAVITGGEPLLHEPKIGDLARTLARDVGMRVEVETNGTVTPTGRLVEAARFNVSPKLTYADAERGVTGRVVPEAIDRLKWSNRATWKFVVRSVDHLDEVERDWVDRYGLDPATVYIMPEGRDHDTIRTRLATLTDAVIKRGWRITPRLHVTLWGDTRGR